MSITAHYGFKLMFFDRSRIRNAMNRATFRALSRFGAFVRTAAKSSIRARKKKVSSPGQPPSSKTGILKKYLFFGYDRSTESVVIGPAKVNQLAFYSRGSVSEDGAPATLEYGGVFGVVEVQEPSGYWHRRDNRSTRRNAGKPTRVRRVYIAKRPYMNPALKQEMPKLAPLWANSIKA